MMTTAERYYHDPVFKQLVDFIYSKIKEGELTATEVREAAMLAAIKYEQWHLHEFKKLPEV